MMQVLAALLAARSVDLDHDGYAASIDCNDGDPDTHPGAVDWPFDGFDQDCDGTFACEYRVTQSDGSVVLMPNELEFVRDPNSPSGHRPLSPNGQELLRFDLVLRHPECPSVDWETGTLNASWTDNQHTGWEPHELKVYDVTDRELVWGPVQLNASGDTEVYGDLVPNTRQVSIFAVTAKLTGASTRTDDRVWVDIDGATMRWCALDSCSDLSSVVTGLMIVL